MKLDQKSGHSNSIEMMKIHLLAGLIAVLVAASLSFVGVYNRLNLAFSDVRASSSSLVASGETMIVAIDNKSVAALGGYPLPRIHIAGVLEQLEQGGVGRVFLDIGFGYDGPIEDDTRLVAAMGALGPNRLALPVIVLAHLEDVEFSSLEKFEAVTSQVSADLPYGTDGRIRKVGLDSLDRSVALPSVAAWFEDGDAAVNGEVPIDFGIEASSVPVFSFVDVLEGKIDSGVWEDKNIVIGLSIGGVVQSVDVPRYGSLNRPEVFALSAETLVQGRAVQPVSLWLIVVVTSVICAGMALWMARYNVFVGGVLGLASIIVLLGIGNVLRAKYLLDVPVGIPMFGIGFAYLGIHLVSHPSFSRLRQLVKALVHKIDLNYVKLLHSGQDAIITFTPEGKLLTMNSAGEEMFGRQAEDCIGQQISDFLSEESVSLISDASEQQPGRLQVEVSNSNGVAQHLDLSYNAMPSDDSWVGLVSIRDITEMKSREEKFAYAATHDGLTGLANRAAFDEHLDATLQFCVGTNQPFAVLLIDLDKFKQVNDTIGHHAGDAVLTTVSRRLKSVLRKSDLVARLGGDEFGIIMTAPVSSSDAKTLAQKLVDLVAEPIDVEGDDVCVGASIGVAMYSERVDDAKRLVKNADQAMYRAKENGRNGFEIAGD